MSDLITSLGGGSSDTPKDPPKDPPPNPFPSSPGPQRKPPMPLFLRILLALMVLALAGFVAFTTFMFWKKSVTTQQELEAKLVEEKNMKKSYDDLKAEVQRLLGEYNALKDQKSSQDTEMDGFKSVVADRDNLLAQIKIAYQERDNAFEEKDRFLAEIDVVKETYERKLELKKTDIKELERKLAESETQIELIQMQKKLDRANEEAGRLTQELLNTEREYDQLYEERNVLQSDMELMREQISDLEQENATVISQREGLKEDIRRIPSDLERVALERDKLKLENAAMHYNLGLLFVQNGEYDLAIREFEEVLKLTPKDADAIYNLGLIYARHLNDEKRAIELFRKFIKLRPNAKHKNWVQEYIATHHAWMGEEKLA